MRTPQATDIRADGAYNGTSMSPEQRERSAVQSYLEHMQRVRAEFDAWRTETNAAALDEDLEDYRSRYAAKMNAFLAAHSRIASQFVTGASGWTGSMIRSMEKKNATVDARRADWLQWSAAQLTRLRRRYNPRLIDSAPLSSDDPAYAIGRLQDKIAHCEAFQEAMKAANAIIRRKLSDDDKIALLLEIEGISETTARALLKPDWGGRVGFPAFELANNGANIRRMQQRIVELERKLDAIAVAAETGDVERDYPGGIRYLENTAANRVQIFFPGKPPETIRSLLKGNGFRWAPSEGAWQRQLTGNGTYAAQYVLNQVTHPTQTEPS